MSRNSPWPCMAIADKEKRKVKGLEWGGGGGGGGRRQQRVEQQELSTLPITVKPLYLVYYNCTLLWRFPCNYYWPRRGQQPSTSPWPYAHRIFPVSEHLTAASSFSGSCQRRWGLCLLLFLVPEWMILAQAAWVWHHSGLSLSCLHMQCLYSLPE